MKKRTAMIRRQTKETDITVSLNIDGSGKYRLDTGIGFLDHMLELFAFWGFFDITVKAKGDMKVDIHHTNEDIGIVLGQAFNKALGNRKGIRRLSSASASQWRQSNRVIVVHRLLTRGFLISRVNGGGISINQRGMNSNTQNIY